MLLPVKVHTKHRDGLNNKPKFHSHGIKPNYLPPAGREIIKRIPCVRACVRVLLSVCHAFIKGCT